MEHLVFGKWERESNKAGWNPIAGYGMWTVKNGRHCLKITGTDARDFEIVEPERCYEVWIDEFNATITFASPERPGKRIVVKDDATGDVARLNGMSN